MARAYASADPEYQPKAALWLIEKYGRTGQWEVVDRIRSTINTRIGPTFQRSATTRRAMQLPLWRAQLLSNDATPRIALAAAHALAVFDDPSTVPALMQRLQTGDDQETDQGVAESTPGLWWQPIVRDHVQQNTAHVLASELFLVIDRIYTGPALAHAEGHVEDPVAMVAGIVHAIDGLTWAPTFSG